MVALSENILRAGWLGRHWAGSVTASISSASVQPFCAVDDADGDVLDEITVARGRSSDTSCRARR